MSSPRFRTASYVLLTATMAAGQLACSRGESAGAPPSDAAEVQAPGSKPAAASAVAGERPTPPPTPGREAPVATVPLGSSLTFVVTDLVVAGEHPAGHRFSSILASAVSGLDGGVVLPEGTAGRWVVTESTADDGTGRALLAVRLEEVRVGGRWYPVQATVTSAGVDVDAPDSKGETAAKIGAGAVAGAVAGRIIGGGGKGALKGAAVGTVMGTVVALSTRDGSAALREGSRITVRLDDQLVLQP